MTRDEVIRRGLDALDGVTTAWIFGSVAHTDAGPESDLDVALLPTRDLDERALRDRAGQLASPSGRWPAPSPRVRRRRVTPSSYSL